MVPGFVLSLADGALFLLTVLFHSCFDLPWPLMTSEDAQNLCALWNSSKEPTAGWWCQDLCWWCLMVPDGVWWCLMVSDGAWCCLFAIVQKVKKVHQCPECGKKFLSKRTLGIHIDVVHDKNELNQCSTCGYSLKNFLNSKLIFRPGMDFLVLSVKNFHNWISLAKTFYISS